MFSSNDTPYHEFKVANDLGSIINVDDFTQLDIIERELSGFPETICCRFNPGGTYEVSNSIMDNPGDSKYGMTKDQLFEEVWGDSFYGDGTLNVHIRKLREKMEQDPNNPEYIKTVWGTGYILEV